jgi:type II secretory pathway pseudopilin PulG
MRARLFLSPKNPGAYAARLTKTRVRIGLTLFEVLISLVIFIGSMAAIGQLVSNGVRAALQARFQTQAAMMCEAKLAEVVAGVVPLTQGETVYPDDPNWSWSLALTGAPVPGLLKVDVTVQRQGTNARGKTVFTMARYVRDPQVYITAQEDADRIAQEQAEAAE